MSDQVQHPVAGLSFNEPSPKKAAGMPQDLQTNGLQAAGSAPYQVVYLAPGAMPPPGAVLLGPAPAQAPQTPQTQPQMSPPAVTAAPMPLMPPASTAPPAVQYAPQPMPQMLPPGYAQVHVQQPSAPFEVQAMTRTAAEASGHAVEKEKVKWSPRMCSWKKCDCATLAVHGWSWACPCLMYGHISYIVKGKDPVQERDHAARDCLPFPLDFMRVCDYFFDNLASWSAMATICTSKDNQEQTEAAFDLAMEDKNRLSSMRKKIAKWYGFKPDKHSAQCAIALVPCIPLAQTKLALMERGVPKDADKEKGKEKDKEKEKEQGKMDKAGVMQAPIPMVIMQDGTMAPAQPGMTYMVVPSNNPPNPPMPYQVGLASSMVHASVTLPPASAAPLQPAGSGAYMPTAPASAMISPNSSVQALPTASYAMQAPGSPTASMAMPVPAMAPPPTPPSMQPLSANLQQQQTAMQQAMPAAPGYAMAYSQQPAVAMTAEQAQQMQMAAQHAQQMQQQAQMQAQHAGQQMQMAAQQAQHVQMMASAQPQMMVVPPGAQGMPAYPGHNLPPGTVVMVAPHQLPAGYAPTTGHEAKEAKKDGHEGSEEKKEKKEKKSKKSKEHAGGLDLDININLGDGDDNHVDYHEADYSDGHWSE